MSANSKLSLDGSRITISVGEAEAVATAILEGVGCERTLANEVAQHLVDASLCGVESHGVMRVMQYAEQFQSGYMRVQARARVAMTERGVTEIDGGGGIGIPALRLAVELAAKNARRDGFAIMPVRNVGHTGRLGAFAEAGADNGCLVMIIGGGARERWRQVAPYGGRRAVLPTNPYCFAIPGGTRGPVVIDFATSVIAGGWIFAARSAGAQLPEGAIINANGAPSRDPEDYFAGGAILPKGGPMGYGLAVMAELICEAMLGPVETEVNWLTMAIDTSRYREPHVMQSVAEEILSELRNCPPAPGFDRVEVPGERERNNRAANQQSGLSIPERTWREILALSERLGSEH